MTVQHKRLSIIRTEPIPEGKLEQYQKDDLNKNQQLDWEDDFQRECKIHERSYHIKCVECYP